MTTYLFNLFLNADVVAASSTLGALGLGHFSELELFFIAMVLLVLIAGFGSLLKLSFSLMQLQKLRALEKYHPELLKKAGLENLAEQESWWQRIYKKWTDNVPLDEEASILLDHNYDGVMELDNNLPPWWKAVFYISIAIAPVYLYINHFSDYAVSSTEAYELEMSAAEADIKAYLATQSDLIDESNVVLLEEPNALASGEMIYNSKCMICHGKLGEGGIGPNLTDDYWLHGGSIVDIFKTVKYGVPDMGMISWKNELKPGAMQEVSSYIKSLHGSNPPNAKDPQGDYYEEEEVASEAPEEEQGE